MKKFVSESLTFTKCFHIILKTRNFLFFLDKQIMTVFKRISRLKALASSFFWMDEINIIMEPGEGKPNRDIHTPDTVSDGEADLFHRDQIFWSILASKQQINPVLEHAILICLLEK